jgi:nucleotide-binding universal stress UspA family protein
MLSLKKVLFPVDFSDRCAGAAHFVEALAGRFEAELTLLHVVEPADYMFGTMEFGGTTLHTFRAERMAQSRKMLDGFLGGELGYFNVKRVLVEGDPATEVVDYAKKEQSDIIMLPSHGYGPFRRFILGSVTAKVLHDAACPVWTGVHLEEAPPLEAIKCKSIVCAVDLGPRSLASLQWAAGLAEEYGSDITLVHAVPVAETRPAVYLEQEYQRDMMEAARAELDKLRREAGITARICVGGGDPASVVKKSAEDHQADLVVIGRGAIADGPGRLRTHSYSIIRQSPCPVVSV